MARRSLVAALMATWLSLTIVAPAHAFGFQGKDDGKASKRIPSGMKNSHAFAVKPTKFKPDDFPVTVQFRAMDHRDVIAQLEYKGAGDRPFARIPEGVPHVLYVRTAKHDFMVYWGYYVVPVGADYGQLLPFGQ